MKKALLAAFAGLLIACSAQALDVSFTNSLVNETGLAYNNTYTLDMGPVFAGTGGYGVDYLSFQAVYSTYSAATDTFTDGTASTATITVSSTNASNLTAAAGSDTVVIASTNGLTNASLVVNGNYYTQGYQWAVAATTMTTLVQIMNAVNASAYGVTASTTVTGAAGKLTLTCTTNGTFCNNYTLSAVGSSTMTVGSANFSGGRDNAYLVLTSTDGTQVTLTQGTDWITTPSTSSTVTTATDTAKSMASAIANSSFGSLVKSTWTTGSNSSGIVASTATYAGANNYHVYAFPSKYFTVSNSGVFFGGTASNVNTASQQINLASHGLTTALPVLYTASAGTSPGVLIPSTTYYPIIVDANNFKLASTSAKAQAGTADVGLSTQTTGGGGSFVVTPLTFSGTPSFKWQASNNNKYWTDVNTSSVTFASPYTAASTLWDFDRVNYRYIRLNVTGPTQGGLALTVTGLGKR